MFNIPMLQTQAHSPIGQAAQRSANTALTNEQAMGQGINNQASLQKMEMLQAQQQKVNMIEAIKMKAIQGDPQAMQQLSGYDPDTASKIQDFRNKKTLEMGQIATAFKGTPLSEREKVYPLALKELRARGFDISSLPSEYVPEEIDQKVDFLINSARDIEKQLAQPNREIRDTNQGVVSIDPTTGQALPVTLGGKNVSPIDRSQKTEVNITNEAESKFAEEFGKTNAQEFFKYREKALDAKESIRSAAVAENLLNEGIITGFGANFKIGLGKALQAAGYNKHQNAIANTEAYVGERAKEVGRIIKLFGAGTGLSDADREFALKAAAGNITYTEKSLRKLINIQKQANQNIIKNYNKMASEIPQELSPFPLQIELSQQSNSLNKDTKNNQGGQVGNIKWRLK